ncbi:ATP-binding cassette domain-containing protein [Accumulibacter sp.]|uniref:ATP-binding cassette domain-containing protein n=1 Tax=Candidatus Accumulibacter proximus TaxID=2954385 RepID=A0A935UGW6_9PROT|nr:ATP-binding cassette domain-containing protein [Accumulibacter sp.]MBK7676102.1 ATP-binding cassette domain-containing protein [Candidatus Accumulibacter proximus]MBL8374112.1 ATP-binding cassette domain-containing protein [Accumulibacter sp.]
MDALLQLADVSLIIGQTRVLDHLDFAMEQGEIHALLGANGCGKSSLAFMVMGCQGYAPSSGSVRFAGERKRIEMAAMLAIQPRLAILDEPAARVDVLSLDEVTEAIRKLRSGGSSVLLITHQEDVAACADRASQLFAGTIVFSGSPAAVAEHYRGRSCVRCDRSVCAHA